MLSLDRRFASALLLASSLLLLGSLLTPGSARAETACIASDGVEFSPFTEEGAVQPAVGTLSSRTCYAVMGRGGGRTRLWVTRNSGFQGEVEVSDVALAQVLVDDVELRLEPDGEVFGEALSGMLVVIEKALGGGTYMVRSIEGRVQLHFLVSESDIYPAQSWSEPDPDELPDSGWPTASLPLPPSPVALTRRAGGYNVRAEVGGPLFHLDDVLQDPDFGGLRMEYLDQRMSEAKVRIVGRSSWVEGWLVDVEWAGEPPASGWNSRTGVPSPKTRPVGSRQIHSKGAELSTEPKGDAVGSLVAESWVDVLSEDGAWAEVSAAWAGGSVRGWIEKKALVKEKKQGQPPQPFVQPVAAVVMGNLAVQWQDSEGHEEDPELDLDLVRAAAVVDIGEFRRLYAEGLRRDSGLAGELTLRMVVAPSGEVTDLKLAVDSLADSAVKGAVWEVGQSLQLPERQVRRGSSLNHDFVVWLQYLFQPMGL